MKKLLCLLGVVLLSLTSCSKESVSTAPKTVATATISELTGTSATTGALVSVGFTNSVSERGIVYSTSTAPTISDTKIKEANAGTGSFISNLTGLSFGTTYYVRAYAIAGGETIYGNEQVFTTNKAGAPTVATVAITDLTGSSATTGGTVSVTDGSPISNRGVVYSTTSDFSSDSHAVKDDNPSTGTFSINLTGLSFGTTYYVKTYAINTFGTTYGDYVTFTTNKALLPTITTTAITLAGANAVTTGGTVSVTDGSPISERGIVYGTSTAPTISGTKRVEGTGTGTFSSQLTDLLSDTIYYVRAYATNSGGTAYGEEISFKIMTGVSNTVDSNISFLVSPSIGNLEAFGAAQSFIPAIDTKLAAITVKVADLRTAGYFWLNVYEGDGIGGTLLRRKTVMINSPGLNTFTFYSPIPISSGKTYTFGLTSYDGGDISVVGVGGDISVYVNEGNTYTKGMGYQNVNGTPIYDLYFSLIYSIPTIIIL